MSRLQVKAAISFSCNFKKFIILLQVALAPLLACEVEIESRSSFNRNGAATLILQHSHADSTKGGITFINIFSGSAAMHLDSSSSRKRPNRH